MLQCIGYKHLITIVTIYVVIVFTGAFIVKTNSSWTNDGHLLSEGNDQSSEDYLSFLDGFIVEDVLESPLQIDPDVQKKRIVKRSTSAVPVPQYMLDVYEFLSDRKHHVKFDTARSFRSSNSITVSTSFPNDLKVKDCTFYPISFNVSHFPASEITLFAQVRIQVLNEGTSKPLGSHKIQLYSSWKNPPMLLANKHFNPAKDSVLTINVTTVFQKAMDSDEKQLRFQIAIPNELLGLTDMTPEIVDGPQLLVLSKTSVKKEQVQDTILNRMRRSFKQTVKEFPSTMADVTGTYDRSDRKIFNQTEVTWRSDFQVRKKRRRRRRSEDEDEEAEEQSNYIVEELGRIRKGKLKRKKNPCRRKPLHVSFAAINYDQWIIAPPTYEAFECTGRCSFPMSAHLAPTKHAIIQTLMHSLEPKQVSRACCVPITLSPISILYVEDDETVTFKYDYEDMVVAECGCR